MPPKLISIIGPDGSGKTTQAHLLIDYLKNRGLNYEYKWLRFNHFFSLPVLGIARLMGLSEMITLENSQRIGYHYFYKSKIISWFYYVTLFIDTLIITIIKVYIPIKIFNRKIISDRFIYDTIIDLMISTGNNGLYYEKWGRLFSHLIPSDSSSILLISDEITLRSRRSNVKYDKNLGKKIELYSKVASKFGIPVINSNKSIETIKIEILEILNE